MGVRYRPGSASRHHGGAPHDGLDAIDRYGVGEKDPITGLYESYDLPEGHEAHGGETVAWQAILTRRPLLVADFASEYGIRLNGEMDRMTWREFADLTVGLLAADTRLARAFQPETEAPL